MVDVKVLKVNQTRAWVLEARVEIGSQQFEFQVSPRDAKLERNVFHFSVERPKEPNFLAPERILEIADQIESVWERMR